MFILAYFCSGFFVLALALALLAARLDQTHRGLLAPYGRLALLSMGALVGAIGAFLAGSVLVGLITFGQAGDWRYPAQYLAAGPIGWIIATMPLLGLVAPLLMGWWIAQARLPPVPGPESDEPGD